MASPSKQMKMTTKTPFLSVEKPAPVAVPAGYILGMGNPLLDMVVTVEQSFLDKYELKLNNALLADPKHVPMYAELVKEHKVEYVAGGATQNSIRVCQWMLQQPGCTSFIGSVGPKTCDFGKTLKSVAQADGVQTLYYESTSQTGTCAVIVNSGERSLVANLSAANEYQHSHLAKKEVKAALDAAHIYYSAGFFLTVPQGPESAMQVAKHASESGKLYCLNFAAPFICQFFFEKLNALMPFADFVFGNESEAAEYATSAGWDPKDLSLVAHKVASLGKERGSRGRVVVITQGCDPTIVYADGAVTLYPVPLLPKARLVDTNGAGDAFVGGFLSRLAMTEAAGLPWDLETCVRAGQYASRLVIQESGCKMPAFPDFV